MRTRLRYLVFISVRRLAVVMLGDDEKGGEMARRRLRTEGFAGCIIIPFCGGVLRDANGTGGSIGTGYIAVCEDDRDGFRPRGTNRIQTADYGKAMRRQAIRPGEKL